MVEDWARLRYNKCLTLKKKKIGSVETYPALGNSYNSHTSISILGGGGSCVDGAVTYDIKAKQLKVCAGKSWTPLNVGGSPSAHYANALFGGEPIAYFKYVSVEWMREE